MQPHVGKALDAGGPSLDLHGCLLVQLHVGGRCGPPYNCGSYTQPVAPDIAEPGLLEIMAQRLLVIEPQ